MPVDRRGQGIARVLEPAGDLAAVAAHAAGVVDLGAAARARLEAARGRWRGAIGWGERALAAGPDIATLGLVGDAWAARGDSSRAAAYWARAEAAGCRVLVLTVDTPMLGRRERDARNRFALPEGIEPAHFSAIHHLVAARAVQEGQSPFHAQVQQLFDPSLDWDQVAWLRSISRMPLLLKGVVTPEDARLAVQAGVAGIIVSNHGGRQLDGAEATILALPRVVEAVAGALPVMMDGGIRRGVHVLTALALGAQAVFIGRPYLWGLAVDGERGVREVLELLRQELELAMALSGRSSVDRIDRSLVAEG